MCLIQILFVQCVDKDHCTFFAQLDGFATLTRIITVALFLIVVSIVFETLCIK